MLMGGVTTTRAARERFLACVAQGMRVSTAVAAAGLSRSRAYELKAADPDFAAAWQSALARARPAAVPLPGFEAACVRNGRLALLLKCRPPEFQTERRFTVYFVL
jgi:hypothetical protein